MSDFKELSFVVKNAGVVCMRQCSCWCLPCISALMQSALDWVDPHSIDGSVSSKYETTAAYDFKMETCTKKKGADVRKTIAERKASSREMTSNLTPGTWMLFVSSEVEQLIWLGRAMTKHEWGNACIWKTKQQRSKSNLVVMPLMFNGILILRLVHCFIALERKNLIHWCR